METLRRNLPEWWVAAEEQIATLEKPAGVIIDGRKNGISEEHIRRYAYEISVRKIEQATLHNLRDIMGWIGRFMKSFNFGSDDDRSFFERESKTPALGS